MHVSCGGREGTEQQLRTQECISAQKVLRTLTFGLVLFFLGSAEGPSGK